MIAVSLSRFRRRLAPFLAVALVSTCVSACDSSSTGGSDSAAPGSSSLPGIPDANPDSYAHLVPEITAEHPWDPSSFTQGLEMDPSGELVVGTGLNGKSRIYRTSVDGVQSDAQTLDPKYFGEGITIHGDSVWQLTWKEGTAFRRDLNTLEEKATASYEGEGWGLCSDGQRLIMSDGSGTLSFRDPETFAEIGSQEVRLDGKATSELNELECTEDGKVLANVWQTNAIYEINPENGEVTGVIDTTGVFPAQDKPGADVLNGIAQIPGTDRYLLTGKLWDTLYEVRFTPAMS